MSTQYPKSSERRSGRGPRRPRNRNDDRGPRDPRDERDSRDSRDTYEPRGNASKAPAKLSLWQKIVGFFSPKKASTNGSSRAPQGRSASPTATTTSRYPSSTGTPAAPATPRQARKPEAIEVTSPKVYVGNLSFDAGESDLQELFNGVGAVQSAEIVTHSHTQKSKGFGFVTLSSIDEAKRAVGELHDKEFMGRKLVVSGAKTPVAIGALK